MKEVLKVAVLSLALMVFALAVTWGLCWFTQQHNPSQSPLTWAEVYQIAEMVVLTLGLGSLAMLWRQSRLDANWNKHISYHQYFSELPTDVVRNGLTEVLRAVDELDVTVGFEKISDEAAQKIHASADHSRAIKRYLDQFEQLCGAINAGIVDRRYAYEIEGSRVIRVNTIFQPYICLLRPANGRAYIEIERLATLWMAERQKEGRRFNGLRRLLGSGLAWLNNQAARIGVRPGV